MKSDKLAQLLKPAHVVAARGALRIAQTELADAIGCNVKTIKRIELEPDLCIAVTTPKTLIAIIDYFESKGVTISISKSASRISW